MNPETWDDSWPTYVGAIANEPDRDVILYNGPLVRPWDNAFIQLCATRRKRPNVVLILVTEGGDADCAYRIARCLQTQYESFQLFVTGYCKSAGTLLATGAHELIMSNHGELGPLDVQLSKKDELWQRQSGLIGMDTLRALQGSAFEAFEQFFLQLKSRSGDTVSLRTATEIATELTSGLFAPLYTQVDPLDIGEARRAMSIANDYGDRLFQQSRNIAGEDVLERLTSGYPSHGFVIDRLEAEELFLNVREPTEQESALAIALGSDALYATPVGSEGVFVFLNDEWSEDDEDATAEASDDSAPADAEASDDSARPGGETVAATVAVGHFAERGESDGTGPEGTAAQD